MEYVYAAMLLHAKGKEISESSVESVMKAGGIEYDASRVKAMVAAIKNINIDEAIAKAAFAPAAATAGSAAAPAEKKEEDNKKTEEEAAAGLGALFG